MCRVHKAQIGHFLPFESPFPSADHRCFQPRSIAGIDAPIEMMGQNRNGAGIAADPTLTGVWTPEGILGAWRVFFRFMTRRSLHFRICRPALAPVPEQIFRLAKSQATSAYLSTCPRPVLSSGVSSGSLGTSVLPDPSTSDFSSGLYQ